MSGLSELKSLIKAQEERLESLRPTLELFENVSTATESRIAEFAALVEKRSKKEEMCTAREGSKKWNRITSQAQSARDLLQSAQRNYQEIQRKYNGHLEIFKSEKLELQRLKIEHQKVILSKSLQSLGLFNETTNASLSAKELKAAQEELFNSQFSYKTRNR